MVLRAAESDEDVRLPAPNQCRPARKPERQTTLREFHIRLDGLPPRVRPRRPARTRSERRMSTPSIWIRLTNLVLEKPR
jgi:hypothetical protein